MTSHRGVIRGLLGLTALIALAGCAVSDPTQYYTLRQPAVRNAPSEVASTTGRSAAEPGAVTIGVGPVVMPAYLDRGQIVTRTDADQVRIVTFHRWAEPLSDGIARVLGEEIGARVGTERIVMFPWPGGVARTIQYQVVVGVSRFDGRPGGDVTLDTRWRILGRDKNELAFKRSTITETTAGPGYEAMIDAMTRAVVTLGQEIAAQIRAIPR